MIIDNAKKVLKIEAESILNLIQKIDISFESLVKDICQSRGRVIITGIGKSGLIGRKNCRNSEQYRYKRFVSPSRGSGPRRSWDGKLRRCCYCHIQ